MRLQLLPQRRSWLTGLPSAAPLLAARARFDWGGVPQRQMWYGKTGSAYPRMTLNSAIGRDRKLNILVTGATGHLGTAVCAALLDRGHTVRATDLKYVQGFPTEVKLGDLRDEHFVYRVLEGCDTVVHLGNHPNAFVGLSPQRIFAENCTMNANVFWASYHLEVPCLVFSSSIQVVLGSSIGSRNAPCLPYLPLDGEAPTNPGVNSYAASKEVAELLLRSLVQDRPSLSATALRFPMLPRAAWLNNLESAAELRPGMINLGDAFIHLQIPDAAELVARVAERRVPGYHQYLPGSSISIRNWTISELVKRFFPSVPLKRPLATLTDFADGSALVRDLDFAPRLRAAITLSRD